MTIDKLFPLLLRLCKNMKRFLLILIALFVFTTFAPQSVEAYGGGGPVFPPPPRVRIIREFEIITLQLPFNRTRQLRLPKFRVEVEKTQNNQLSSRWSDFLNRVRTGNR